MSFNYNVTFTNVPPLVNNITIINVTEATKASHRSERERKTEHVSVKILRCTKCGETDTTQWRTGPEGKKTLCNRCGIRYTKWLKFEKFVHERMSIQRLLIQEDPE